MNNYILGNDLLATCEAPDQLSYQFCIGYITGIADALEMYRSAANRPRCIPANAVSQLKDVVVKFLHDFPTVRHLGASTLVAMELSKAWDCGELFD